MQGAGHGGMQLTCDLRASGRLVRYRSQMAWCRVEVVSCRFDCARDIAIDYRRLQIRRRNETVSAAIELDPCTEETAATVHTDITFQAFYKTEMNKARAPQCWQQSCIFCVPTAHERTR